MILQSGAIGKGGEIILLEMGKPIKIDQLARDLIKLSGFEPEIDIPVVYTGLRPGEKLYEELDSDKIQIKLKALLPRYAPRSFLPVSSDDRYEPFNIKGEACSSITGKPRLVYKRV